MRGGFVGFGGWQKNSFIDYPGVVSTVLFYSGCNLRCPYCHNPSLALATEPEEVDPERIREYLHRRLGIIEGVVLSGGEPTIQASLQATVREVRAMGYLVKLDTNGLRPDVVESVGPDYLALDVKTVPSRYGELLGARERDVEQRLRRSIAVARRMGEKAEVRITAAPGIVDRATTEEFAGLLEGVHRVYIQPMQQRHELLDPSYGLVEPLAPEEIEGYRERLARVVRICRVRSADNRARATLWSTPA